MAKIDIAGLQIDSITKKQLLEAVLARIKSGQKTFIATPYSEFLYHSFQNPKLLEIFNKADFAVADGIGIFWAKKYLNIPLTARSYWGKIFQAAWQLKYSLAAIVFNPKWIKSALPEKIVGADLVWDLAKLAAENNLSIFLLGGFGDTPKIAAEKFHTAITHGREFNKQFLIAGYSNKNSDDKTVIDDINKSNADILMIAYGPIKQETWIADNLEKLNIKLVIGVGGTFDYIAGKKSSPPKFIRYSGLEWLWRLITQPYRVKRIINATFGLMWGLWHYKVFSNLPLRPNAVVVIVNNKNQVLLCERNPKNFGIDIVTNKQSLKKNNYWQFPQGGVDGNESVVETAQREALEETGLSQLELIKISQQTHTYIWNNALRGFWKNRTKPNIGQNQQIVYFKFSGGNNEIKVDQNEFINFTWVDINNLRNVIHPERMALAEIVLKDLA